VNGSSPLNPTYWINIRPIKNPGIDTSATEIAMISRSRALPRAASGENTQKNPLPPRYKTALGESSHRLKPLFGKVFLPHNSA
jgi:hypothetical protein